MYLAQTVPPHPPVWKLLSLGAASLERALGTLWDRAGTKRTCDGRFDQNLHLDNGLPGTEGKNRTELIGDSGWASGSDQLLPSDQTEKTGHGDANRK